jgi:hypothetical protein
LGFQDLNHLLLVFADGFGLLELNEERLKVLLQLAVLFLVVVLLLAGLQLPLQLLVLYFLKTQLVLQQFPLERIVRLRPGFF